MNNLKKKFTAIMLVLLIAMVAVMPASASTVHTLTLNGIHPGYADVLAQGTVARISIVNEGEKWWSYSPMPARIYYALYGSGDLLVDGYVYPYEMTYSFPYLDVEFSGEYEITNPNYPEFSFYISCDGYSTVCNATATLEILE